MWYVARFGTICTIQKNVENTHGGLLLLVKLQAEACNFTKSNIPPWVFFTFLKLIRWYQFAQRITNYCQRNYKDTIESCPSLTVSYWIINLFIFSSVSFVNLYQKMQNFMLIVQFGNTDKYILFLYHKALLIAIQMS